MKFSVIVPIFNVEKYIRQCVESLINQTVHDLEIILVDDGSPDACPKICDEFAALDRRIKVIHKKNGGLVSARQAGAAIASGDYVSCVDGDDWVDPHYFEKFAESIASFSPDLVRGGFISVSEENLVAHPFTERSGYYGRQDIEERIFPSLIEKENASYFRNNLWGNVFKRELYVEEQLSLDPRIKIGEDCACLKAIVAKAQSMYILDECLYYYRSNPTSMTKNKKPFPTDGPELIGKHLEARIASSRYDFGEQISRLVTHQLFNVCYSAFYKNERFKTISSHLDDILSNAYYQKCIEKCRFSGTWKGCLAHMALKNRLYFLMWLYAKIK